MSNITWCYFCVHSNTDRRSGDQIRCIKKHRYVAEHSTCKEYQDKSIERLTELFFKEKEK